MALWPPARKLPQRGTPPPAERFVVLPVWHARHTTLVLSGEFDLAALPRAQHALARTGAARVRLDLHRVHFIDVCSLRWLRDLRGTEWAGSPAVWRLEGLLARLEPVS